MLKTSRSRQGQEQLAARHVGFRRDGFFVEVGAADGVTDSNTFALETELGWRGLCIEPDPEQYQRLCAHRRCQRDPRCAVPPHLSARRVFEFLPGGLYGGVVGLSDGHVGAGRAAAPILVPGAALVEILDAHGVPPLIDYLSVDIEGAELAALDDPALLRRFRPLVLSVDHNGHLGLLQARRRDRVRELLWHAGYECAALETDDLFFYSLRLPAARAELHGSEIALEEHDGVPSIGFWTEAHEHVSWRVDEPLGLRCAVDLSYAADEAARGARFEISVTALDSDGRAERLEVAVEVTGGWTAFTGWARVGEVDKPPGPVQVAVRPVALPQGVLMNLRAVRLVPIGAAP